MVEWTPEMQKNFERNAYGHEIDHSDPHDVTYRQVKGKDGVWRTDPSINVIYDKKTRQNIIIHKNSSSPNTKPKKTPSSNADNSSFPAPKIKLKSFSKKTPSSNADSSISKYMIAGVGILALVLIAIYLKRRYYGTN
jgi:hypothetical protein